MGDVVPIDLEVTTQVRARIRPPEPIGAEHGVAHRHVSAHLFRIHADVVGRGDRRALTPFQQFGDVRLALRLRFRVEAVEAFAVGRIAGEFVEAGAGPDVGGDAEVLVQQFGRGDGFAQDGAAAHQLHAQFALLGLAGVLEQVHALDDAFGGAFGHVGVRVVFVHQGEVPVLILLFGQHALHAVLEQGHHFVAEGGVVAAAVRDQAGLDHAVAVFVLQAFAVEGGAAGGGAKQEAARAHVGGLPGAVADALEAEHRVIDVQRQHLQVVGAVAGGGRQPRRERAGFGDAFFQHLAGDVFAVVHELVAVDRLVLLSVRGVDAELAEQAFHAEGAGFVRDDGNQARADLLVAQRDVERLHERHGGADLALAGALEQAVVSFELRRFQ